MNGMPDKIVKRLLEDDHEPMSLDAIKAYVQQVSLADGIEFHIGFAVYTSSEGLIEINAREHGTEPDWDVINAAIALIERNAISALNDVGMRCRSEGHSNTGELVGSAFVTGGTPGFDVVKTGIEMGEPFRTSSGTIGLIKKGLEISLYHGVPSDVASLIDVDISFFDTEKIERVENGGGLEDES